MPLVKRRKYIELAADASVNNFTLLDIEALRDFEEDYNNFCLFPVLVTDYTQTLAGYIYQYNPFLRYVKDVEYAKVTYNAFEIPTSNLFIEEIALGTIIDDAFIVIRYIAGNFSIHSGMQSPTPFEAELTTVNPTIEDPITNLALRFIVRVPDEAVATTVYFSHISIELEYRQRKLQHHILLPKMFIP